MVKTGWPEAGCITVTICCVVVLNNIAAAGTHTGLPMSADRGAEVESDYRMDVFRGIFYFALMEDVKGRKDT